MHENACLKRSCLPREPIFTGSARVYKYEKNLPESRTSRNIPLGRIHIQQRTNYLTLLIFLSFT